MKGTENGMDIGVVLVTYNRREKLIKALECYEKQIFLPTYILIVDNCSTDGTQDILSSWKETPSGYKKEVIFLDKNAGGSGGYYIGMEAAAKKDAEWIWLADDDAYPRQDALQKLNDYYEKLSEEKKAKTAALCSAVYNNGKIHAGHRNRLKLSKFKCTIEAVDESEYKKPFRLDVFSYVGACIKKEALLRAGFVERDYFIYSDDREHSLRIRKEGYILCIPESIIDHDTPPFRPNEINWKRYYGKRNDFLMIRKHFPGRYFVLRYIRRYLEDVSVFSGNDRELKKILRAAYWDALRGKKGMHSVYKPGWKPGE